MPTGRVAVLEEEGVASANPTSGEDSESEVEVVDGLNVHLAQDDELLSEERVEMLHV